MHMLPTATATTAAGTPPAQPQRPRPACPTATTTAAGPAAQLRAALEATPTVSLVADLCILEEILCRLDSRDGWMIGVGPKTASSSTLSDAIARSP